MTLSLFPAICINFPSILSFFVSFLWGSWVVVLLLMFCYYFRLFFKVGGGGGGGYRGTLLISGVSLPSACSADSNRSVGWLRSLDWSVAGPVGSFIVIVSSTNKYRKHKSSMLIWVLPGAAVVVGFQTCHEHLSTIHPRIHWYLFTSDIKRHTGICLGDVAFIQYINRHIN